MKESEFGKGLVICLVKFAEHRMRWMAEKPMREKMRQINPKIFTMSHDIEMHFNGASDHLYEIEIPKVWRRKRLGKMIKELQAFGLKIGHGFSKTEWTEDDLEKAYNMCQEIALLIDKELGLKPQIGQW